MATRNSEQEEYEIENLMPETVNIRGERLFYPTVETFNRDVAVKLVNNFLKNAKSDREAFVLSREQLDKLLGIRAPPLGHYVLGFRSRVNNLLKREVINGKYILKLGIHGLTDGKYINDSTKFILKVRKSNGELALED